MTLVAQGLMFPFLGTRLQNTPTDIAPSSCVVIETDSDVHYKQRHIIEFLSADNKSLENVHKRLESYGEDTERKHC